MERVSFEAEVDWIVTDYSKRQMVESLEKVAYAAWLRTARVIETPQADFDPARKILIVSCVIPYGHEEDDWSMKQYMQLVCAAFDPVLQLYRIKNEIDAVSFA